MVAGSGLAGLAASAGGSGHDGLRFFLLGALLSCSAGALYAVATGAIDSARGRHVGRGRVVAAVTLGLLALLLPAMLVGVRG